MFQSFTNPGASSANSSLPAGPNSSVYHFQQYGLHDHVFQLAYTGWRKLKVDGQVTKDTLCICDFSQSSTNERLYVIDMAKGKVLFHTLVAHGKNSGEEYAHSFSNTPASNKSSLGFYSTGQAYMGEHGLSLKLKGLEKGVNDKAEERAIVMHGADYAGCNFIERYGHLGRSFGCPSVPYKWHEPIIKTIKEGACLFIYYPDKNYLASSALLK